jgi:ActR/RegA family two-component response regulator
MDAHGTDRNQLYKSLLLIDDDSLMIKSIQRSLKRGPWLIRTASTAREAIIELQKNAPDVVLTDVILGDGSGVDVAQAAARLCPSARVVAMTGVAMAPAGVALAHAGVAVCLAKPFDMEQLVAAVDETERTAVPALAEVASRLVGRLPWREAVETLRTSMLRRALNLTGHNRQRTAQMLGISRQAVQRSVRELGGVGRCAQMVPLTGATKTTLCSGRR